MLGTTKITYKIILICWFSFQICITASSRVAFLTPRLPAHHQPWLLPPPLPHLLPSLQPFTIPHFHANTKTSGSEGAMQNAAILSLKICNMIDDVCNVSFWYDMGRDITYDIANTMTMMLCNMWSMICQLWLWPIDNKHQTSNTVTSCVDG